MKLFRHSFLMIRKTFRNYLLLSVTTFLSFAILFGYFLYTDSNIYNKYKELFRENSNIILSYNTVKDLKNINLLTSQLKKIPNTHYYYTKSGVAKTSFGTECEINFLPSYVWGIFTSADLNGYSGASRMKINGKWSFTLGSADAIVSEQVYQSIAADKSGDKQIKLVFINKKGKKILKKYKVVGSYTSDVAEFIDPKDSTTTDPVYVSATSIDKNDCSIDNIVLTIYTEQKQFVAEKIKDLGLACEEIYTAQNNAISEKLDEVNNKYLISTILFILLGINLYSCFVNTLNNRKFEIGVKRAIGASKLHILLQFLLESFIIMLANVLVSIMFVLFMMTIYKCINQVVFNELYIIMINKESLLLYMIFTLSLTFIFSLIFAYKCTKVEIVKYIKEEL